MASTPAGAKYGNGRGVRLSPGRGHRAGPMTGNPQATRPPQCNPSRAHPAAPGSGIDQTMRTALLNLVSLAVWLAWSQDAAPSRPQRCQHRRPARGHDDGGFAGDLPSGGGVAGEVPARREGAERARREGLLPVQLAVPFAGPDPGDPAGNARRGARPATGHQTGPRSVERDAC